MNLNIQPNELYLLPILILVGFLQEIIILQAAFLSLKLRVPVRATIIPAIILAFLAPTIRQIIPPPFQILPNIFLIIMFIWGIPRVKFKYALPFRYALLSGLFVESVIILFTVAISVFFLKTYRSFLFERVLGYSIGVIIETLPVVALVCFLKKHTKEKAINLQ